jgi:hypothetical protein
MAQAVSRRPLTEEARYRARINVDNVALGHFSHISSGFPLSVSFHRGSQCSLSSGGWWPQFRDVVSPHLQGQQQNFFVVSLMSFIPKVGWVRPKRGCLLTLAY